MLTVHLHDLHFFAHHGVFDGEPVAGGEFEVQLQVSYDEKKITFISSGNLCPITQVVYLQTLIP